MIDLDLYETTLTAIENDPEHHVQSSWRCGSGQCFAGWVGLVDGLRWAFTREELIEQFEEEWGMSFENYALLHGEELAEEELWEVEGVGDVVTPEGKKMHVADYAAHRLGGDSIDNLTKDEADRLNEVAGTYPNRNAPGEAFGLFYGNNTREQLRVALEILKERQG